MIPPPFQIRIPVLPHEKRCLPPAIPLTYCLRMVAKMGSFVKVPKSISGSSFILQGFDRICGGGPYCLPAYGQEGYDEGQ
jgi:hypothetical protein